MPTCGGRSADIVRLWTKAMELSFFTLLFSGSENTEIPVRREYIVMSAYVYSHFLKPDHQGKLFCPC
jgi:hypothetical protein